MNNEDETAEEKQEQQPESVVENFEDVVETQKVEVNSGVSGVEEEGTVEVYKIEESGLPEEGGEMKEVVKKTTEEAEEAKEEYYEELRNNIPNFDDKVEAIKKEGEVRKENQEEYDEKLKDIPNASDLAESFKTEESAEEATEETSEESEEITEEAKEETVANDSSYFPGNRFVNQELSKKDSEIDREENNLSENTEEMKVVVEKATEEATEEANEEYEEQPKNIPNFDDKVEAIKKEDEAREEYNEKLKDIPSASDLAESFKTEEGAEEAIEETSEESEEAKEEYYEELRNNIPNFDDKVEAIKKEGEVRKENQEEYDEKLKDIPNASDLAKSFKTEESAEETAEEVKEEELPAEAKTKTTESPEKEKSCPKCGALFPGTANFCGKCETELGETEIKVNPRIEEEENLAMKAWLEGQKKKGKDTVATRFTEEKLVQKDQDSEENDERLAKEIWLKKQEEKGNGDTVAANFIREELKQSELVENEETIKTTESSKVFSDLIKTAKEIYSSNSDKSKDYESLTTDLDKVYRLLNYLNLEIKSNIPEKNKTREALVGIANKIMKERSLKHEEYLKNRKGEVQNKKAEGSVNTIEDLDFNRNEDRSENNENETKAIDKGIMVKVVADIPSGEHWKTEVLKNSTIRVKAGSKLTITGVIKSSNVVVEKGGNLETSKGFVNMKSKIIYEK